MQQTAAARPWAAMESTTAPALTVVTYTWTAPALQRHTAAQGNYYDWDGELLAQQGWPLQPARGMEIPAVLDDGRTVRGVLLRSSTFQEKRNFDPVIFQSWAVGEPGKAPEVEPAASPLEWDRMLPYALGQFEGRESRLAHLSFVAGAYQARTQTERMFEDVTVVVYYSDQADTVPPTIAAVTLNRGILQATLRDEGPIAAAEAVCELPDRRWAPFALTMDPAGSWQTELPSTISRCYLQVVDGGGNVTTGDWVKSMDYRVYLPLVVKS
jgi:hypothetical protein